MHRLTFRHNAVTWSATQHWVMRKQCCNCILSYAIGYDKIKVKEVYIKCIISRLATQDKSQAAQFFTAHTLIRFIEQ